MGQVWTLIKDFDESLQKFHYMERNLPLYFFEVAKEQLSNGLATDCRKLAHRVFLLKIAELPELLLINPVQYVEKYEAMFKAFSLDQPSMF